MSENVSEKKTLKFAFVAIIVLIACVLAIALLKRYKTEVTPNEMGNIAEFQTDVIYGDIKIKTNDDAFSHDAIEEDSCNNEVAEYLQKNVQKGDTIVHISHGIGVQTLLMAKLVTKSGRVYVFNPSKKYVDAINESAKANDFESRIFASALGMSNRSFSGLLVHKNNFPAISGKIESADYQIPTGYSAMTIDVSSVDEQLPNLQNINVLRINVNSDCSDIIRGAKNLIAKSPKISIICDFSVENYTNFGIFNELENQGFKIYVIHSDGSFLKPITTSELKDVKNGHLLIKR
ncbi:MAG: hypothetical protein K6C34_00020 [Alphaproteobacteria bacterium]|nr:hypothetical protein [Alphaproteobacteria bacterium]